MNTEITTNEISNEEIIAALRERVANLEVETDRLAARRDDLLQELFKTQKDVEVTLKKATFKFDNWKDYKNPTGSSTRYIEYSVEVSFTLQSYRDKVRKARIYTSGDYLDAIEDKFSDHYVAYGEQSDEYKKGKRIYRKAEREAIMFALDQMSIPVEKVRHSYKAGCSCGCSQGWIADRLIRVNGHLISDVHVKVVAASERFAYNEEKGKRA